MQTQRTALAAGDFKLRSIDLYITAACNRKCGYCFLPESYFASRAHMAQPMLRAILDWAVRGTVEEVALLGGEPALHPDFAGVVAAVADRRVQLRTVTNGSRPFRDALRRDAVREALTRVAVSLDAPSAGVVDRLRGRGAFADALATIEALRQAGVPFDINCTAVASTLDGMPDMLRFAEQAGAGRLNIHWYSQVGRAREHAAGEAVSATDWRAKVLEPVSRYRPARPDFELDCELAFAYGLPGEDRDMCAVRDRANLQFFPNGSVFSCGMLVEDDAQSGYLFRAGGLVRRPGASEVTRTATPCPGCPLRAASDGHLPVCIYNRLAVN
jgi:MoaA/NifB/PqqE/SkfB family radical SAM enzyme